MEGDRSQVTGQETALKPCPFCGGETALLFAPGQIHCISCGAAGPDSTITRVEAVMAWNSRIDERTEFAQIIERLKQRGVITEADAARLAAGEVSHGG